MPNTPAAHRRLVAALRPLAGSPSALIAVAHKRLAIANAMVAQKTAWRHSNVAIPG